MKLIKLFLIGAVAALAGQAFALPAPTGAVLVSGSVSKTNCVIATGGALWCWGDNQMGQLGDGTTISSPYPQLIIGAGVTQVAVGPTHTCAVMSLPAAGTLKCWGDNTYHQLGDGTTEISVFPKTISLGTGTNLTGEALASPTTYAMFPTGPAAALSVSVGSAHTCVILSDKSAKCWGDNSMNQLGYGPTYDGIDIPHPDNDNGGMSDPLNYSAAKSLVFRTKVVSGSETDPEYGVAVTTANSVIKTFLKVTTGSIHNCAIMGTAIPGIVKCWGTNANGESGQTDTGSSVTYPKQVVAGQNDDMEDVLLTQTVSGLKAGGSHTCIQYNTLTPAVSGILKCWGLGDSGQLGDGQNTTSPYPVLTMASDVTAFDLGNSHSCAVRLGGLKCFGAGDNRQLGHGSMWGGILPEDNMSRPVFVKGMRSGVSQVVAGADNTCAMVLVGTVPTVKCWGNNEQGQISDSLTDQDLDADMNSLRPDWPYVIAPFTVEF